MTTAVTEIPRPPPRARIAHFSQEFTFETIAGT